MVRTRNSSGRFEKTADGESTIERITYTTGVNREWVNKGFILFLFIVLFSPWMFIVSKSNNLLNVVNRVIDFYDDTFSCKVEATVCNCTSPEKADSGF